MPSCSVDTLLSSVALSGDQGFRTNALSFSGQGTYLMLLFLQKRKKCKQISAKNLNQEVSCMTAGSSSCGTLEFISRIPAGVTLIYSGLVQNKFLK